MSSDNSLVVRDATAVAVQQPGELSVEQVLAQVEKIQILMQKAMHKDEHYGVIPGTPKPTLLKAGAEKLCLMFRLDPQYEVTERRDGDHLTMISRCTLYHIVSGARLGSGMGSCSTRESKYAYRKSERACPKCGQDAIRRSKFGNKGWYCHDKAGGCGAQFAPNDKAIVDQEVGRVANPDLADQFNTVLKMANKRSLVAAVLNVTAASDIFTQDLEDISEARRTVAAESHNEHETVDTTTGEVIQTISEGQQTKLRAVARDRLGLDDAGLHQFAGVEHVSEIRADALDVLLLRIEEMASRPLEPNESFDLAQEIQERQIDPAKVEEFLGKKFEDFTFGDYNRVRRMIQARKPKQAATVPTESASVTPAEAQGRMDAVQGGRAPQSAPKAPSGLTISEAQGKRLYAIAQGDAALLKDVLSRYGYDHSRDIPKSEYEAICKDVEAAAKA